MLKITEPAKSPAETDADGGESGGTGFGKFRNDRGGIVMPSQTPDTLYAALKENGVLHRFESGFRRLRIRIFRFGKIRIAHKIRMKYFSEHK